MKIALVGLAPMFLGLAGAAMAEQSSDPHGPLTSMPKELEVRFALSALPPSLRASATVYVLDPAKGYMQERAGTNGQTCFVGRTEWKFADYRNDVYDPICYDAVGAKTHMRVWFDAAALRARGVPPGEMKRQIEAGFASGTYQAPERAGFSYMTAPVHRTYMLNAASTVTTMSIPHVMYYAPGVIGQAVGAQPCPPCAPYPFVFEPGAHGYIIQRLGDKEIGKIVQDEAVLVRDLCTYRAALCLQQTPAVH